MKRVDTSVNRLAAVFNVCPATLMSEWSDVLYMSRERFVSRGAKDSRGVLVLVDSRHAKREETQLAHPFSNLHTIIMRLVADRGLTSSGVEQSFAAMKELERGARSKCDY